MKKKDENSQVLLAISIGLSAALSLMPSVTAYAEDDVDSGSSGGGEQTEESSSTESNESSENEEVKEAVSEASDAIDSAINMADAGDTDTQPEAAQAEAVAAPEAAEETPAPDASEMIAESIAPSTPGAELNSEAALTGEDGSAAEALPGAQADIVANLSEASGALDIIAGDVSALDQANFLTEEANSDYEAAETAATASVSYADTKTEEAGSAVGTATQAVDEAENSVNDASETVKSADDKYSSESEAEEAKAEAAQAVNAAQGAVEEGKEAVDKAQQKLDEADKALKVAEGAVESAAKEKEDADKAASDAKAQLISLLESNGISYTEDADGSIVVDEEAEITDGNIKTAIDNAQAAADKAIKDAADATKAYEEAGTNAFNAAKAKADAAETNLNEKSKAYDEAVAAYSEDAELEAMLSDIRNQQEKVKEVVKANKTQQDYWNANRTLAYYIARYMLAQDESIDRSTIDTKFNTAGGYVVKKDNASGIEVSYKEKGSDVTKYAYFDYKGYYRDGDVIFTGVHNLMDDADHIIVIQRQATSTNSDGTGKTFAADTVFFSELGINNGEDAYQTKKAAVADALSAKEAAAAEKTAADAALATYADLEEARAILSEAENKLAEAKDGFEENDRLNELISLIKAQQEKVRGVKSDSDYWVQNRILTSYMIEYTLIQQGNVDPSSIVVAKDSKGTIIWEKDNGTMHHYCTVTYKMADSGEEKTAYFDYIAYYDNGETVGGAIFTNIKNSTIYDSSSNLRPDHIVVVQKEKVGDNKFANKGTAFFDEADFNAKADPYQSRLKRIAELEEAVNDARSAVSVAENIKDLKDTADKAESLKDKVNEAKTKVENAANALKKARITQAINAERLQELTNELADARSEYDDAVKEYEAAEKKLGNLLNMVDSMLDSIENGYKVTAPAIAEAESVSDSVKAAEDGTKVDIKQESSAASASTEATGSVTSDDGAGAGSGGTTVTSSETGGSTGSGGSAGAGGSAGLGGSTGASESVGGSGTAGGSSAASGGGTVVAGDTAAAFTAGGASGSGSSGASGSAGASSVTAREASAPGAGSAGGASAGTVISSGTSAASQMEAGVPDGGEDMLEGDVLGQRMAPIVEAFENGTFTRGMMFTEDGLKTPFMWWILIVFFGAKGVQMYMKRRRKAQKTEE